MVKELELKHIIRTSPEKARIYFEDFERFSSFHPLFAGADKISEDHYIVKERMAGAPFIKFRYKAKINVGPDEIIYHGFPFMMILKISFRFFPGTTLSECIVEEKIVITGPGIVGSILKGLIGKMHPRLIASLNSSLKDG